LNEKAAKLVFWFYSGGDPQSSVKSDMVFTLIDPKATGYHCKPCHTIQPWHQKKRKGAQQSKGAPQSTTHCQKGK